MGKYFFPKSISLSCALLESFRIRLQAGACSVRGEVLSAQAELWDENSDVLLCGAIEAVLHELYTQGLISFESGWEPAEDALDQPCT